MPDDATPPVAFTPDVLQALTELLGQWAPKSREQAALNERCWDQLEVAKSSILVQKLPPSFAPDAGVDASPDEGGKG